MILRCFQLRSDYALEIEHLWYLINCHWDLLFELNSQIHIQLLKVTHEQTKIVVLENYV